MPFASANLTSPAWSETDRTDITQTTDVNSDGLDDIIIHHGYSDPSIPYSYGSEVHLNTGTEFARFGFNGSTTISGLVGVDDFDGDGLTDLLIGGRQDSGRSGQSSEPAGRDDPAGRRRLDQGRGFASRPFHGRRVERQLPLCL